MSRDEVFHQWCCSEAGIVVTTQDRLRKPLISFCASSNLARMVYDVKMPRAIDNGHCWGKA